MNSCYKGYLYMTETWLVDSEVIIQFSSRLPPVVYVKEGKGIS